MRRHASRRDRTTGAEVRVTLIDTPGFGNADLSPSSAAFRGGALGGALGRALPFGLGRALFARSALEGVSVGSDAAIARVCRCDSRATDGRTSSEVLPRTTATAVGLFTTSETDRGDTP